MEFYKQEIFSKFFILFFINIKYMRILIVMYLMYKSRFLKRINKYVYDPYFSSKMFKSWVMIRDFSQ